MIDAKQSEFWEKLNLAAWHMEPNPVNLAHITIFASPAIDRHAVFIENGKCNEMYSLLYDITIL